MYLMIRGLVFLGLISLFSFHGKIRPEPGNNKLPGAPGYFLEQAWPQLSFGYRLSEPSGIGIDTSQNIFIFDRTGRKWSDPFPDTLISKHTILMLDRTTGKILNSWGSELFIMPHGLTVDHQNNVWVTDVSLQEVFKFSHDGKLLMKIGITRETGSDSLRFNQPTDVAVAEDGSFYVSDGYGNSRIVKFSAEGKYLFEWGTKGNKPGQFNLPHAIDLDKNGNVYVADRQNDRIQVFDANGKFLKEFAEKKLEDLFAVTIDKTTQHLFAVDFLVVLKYFTKGSNIIEYDTSGHLLTRFGRETIVDAPVTKYHDIAVDNEGSIYVCDIAGNKIQKYRKSSP
jgi:peptidylamidoglycolate lyase